jgi:hypothetical protein
MTSQTFVLLSGALTYGVLIVFAVRELLTLPKSIRGGDEPPPEEPFIPALKPLPECLLPVPYTLNAFCSVFSKKLDQTIRR